MIRVMTAHISNDKGLEEALNRLKETGYEIIGVSFLGYNSVNERLYTIVYEE